MVDDTNDWRELREFAGVDLTASYVLSWDASGGSLVLDLDLCLAPEHPFYEQPRPSQKSCIRAAILEFPYCESVSVDGRKASLGQVDGLEIGRIDGLQRTADGWYRLSGRFGRVDIQSKRPLLRLRDSFAR